MEINKFFLNEFLEKEYVISFKDKDNIDKSGYIKTIDYPFINIINNTDTYKIKSKDIIKFIPNNNNDLVKETIYKVKNKLDINKLNLLKDRDSIILINIPEKNIELLKSKIVDISKNGKNINVKLINDIYNETIYTFPVEYISHYIMKYYIDDLLYNYFKNNPVRIKNPNPDTLNLIKDYYVCGYNSNTKKIFCKLSPEEENIESFNFDNIINIPLKCDMEFISNQINDYKNQEGGAGKDKIIEENSNSDLDNDSSNVYESQSNNSNVYESQNEDSNDKEIKYISNDDIIEETDEMIDLDELNEEETLEIKELEEDLQEITEITEELNKNRIFTEEQQRNSFISSLLIKYDKSTKRIEESINKEYEIFLELKKICSVYDDNGIIKSRKQKGPNYKPLLDKYLDTNFNKSWLLPISNDLKNIYIDKTSGINIKEDFSSLGIKYKSIEKDLDYISLLEENPNNYNFKDYVTDVMNLYTPINKKITKIKYDSTIIRSCIDPNKCIGSIYNKKKGIYETTEIKFDYRRVLGDYIKYNSNYTSIKDEEDKSVYINGDKTGINGFLSLSFNDSGFDTEYNNNYPLSLKVESKLVDLNLIGEKDILINDINYKNPELQINQIVKICINESYLYNLIKEDVQDINNLYGDIIKKDVYGTIVNISKEKIRIKLDKKIKLPNESKEEYEEINTIEFFKNRENLINFQVITDKSIICNNKFKDLNIYHIFNNNTSWKESIRNILPTINEIIVNYSDLLEKCYNEYDLLLLMNRFDINYDSFNNDQWLKLKNIVNNNIKKLLKNTSFDDEIKILQPYNKKGSYHYISDKDLELIKDIYGDYPYKNKIYDTDITRMMWLNGKNDDGKIFVLKKIKNKLEELKEKYKNLDDKKMEKIIERINEDIDKINGNYEELKKTDEYFKNKKDCENKKGPNIVKVYYDIGKLEKDNNKPVLFYDEERDNTKKFIGLDLLAKNPEYKDEKNKSKFIKDIKKKLIELNFISIEEEDKLEQEANHIYNGGKIVKNGDFAIYKDGPINRIYMRVALKEGDIWSPHTGFSLNDSFDFKQLNLVGDEKLSVLNKEDLVLNDNFDNKDVCNNNGDIKDINFDDIGIEKINKDNLVDETKCFYVEQDKNCVPERILRNERELKKLKLLKELYLQKKFFSENIDKEIKNIDDKIISNINKYYKLGNSKEIIKQTKEDIPSFNLSESKWKIYLNRHEYMRRDKNKLEDYIDLVKTIIDRYCFLINNNNEEEEKSINIKYGWYHDIYSLDHKICCSHYKYYRDMSNKKSNITEIYSDLKTVYGMVDEDNIICFNCGEIISDIDFDHFETYDFEESGRQLVLEDENKEEIKYEDKNFLNSLINENQQKIYKLVLKCMEFIYIKLTDPDIYDVILHVQTNLNKIGTEKDYIIMKLKNLKIETINSKYKNQIEEIKRKEIEKFKKEYDILRNRRIILSIFSRIFISICTSINEDYIITGIYPDCKSQFSLSGYPLSNNKDDDKGLRYITCIINNIKSNVNDGIWKSLKGMDNDSILVELKKITEMFLKDNIKLEEKIIEKNNYLEEKKNFNKKNFNKFISKDYYLKPYLNFNIRESNKFSLEKYKSSLLNKNNEKSNKIYDNLIVEINKSTYTINNSINNLLNKKGYTLGVDLINKDFLNYFIVENSNIKNKFKENNDMSLILRDFNLLFKANEIHINNNINQVIHNESTLDLSYKNNITNYMQYVIDVKKIKEDINKKDIEEYFYEKYLVDDIQINDKINELTIVELLNKFIENNLLFKEDQNILFVIDSFKELLSKNRKNIDKTEILEIWNNLIISVNSKIKDIIDIFRNNLIDGDVEINNIKEILENIGFINKYKENLEYEKDINVDVESINYIDRIKLIKKNIHDLLLNLNKVKNRKISLYEMNKYNKRETFRKVYNDSYNIINSLIKYVGNDNNTIELIDSIILFIQLTIKNIDNLVYKESIKNCDNTTFQESFFNLEYSYHLFHYFYITILHDLLNILSKNNYDNLYMDKLTVDNKIKIEKLILYDENSSIFKIIFDILKHMMITNQNIDISKKGLIKYNQTEREEIKNKKQKKIGSLSKEDRILLKMKENMGILSDNDFYDKEEIEQTNPINNDKSVINYDNSLIDDIYDNQEDD